MSDKHPGGRPPLSREKEPLHILIPGELMERIRKAVKQRAGTIAGFVRQAIEEKLEREGV